MDPRITSDLIENAKSLQALAETSMRSLIRWPMEAVAWGRLRILTKALSAVVIIFPIETLRNCRGIQRLPQEMGFSFLITTIHATRTWFHNLLKGSAQS